MKKILCLIALVWMGWACQPTKEEAKKVENGEFNYLSEQFADLKIIRYRIPGFDHLTLQQKKLVYYLSQAGLSGRDIIWDQNYRFNLAIRHALEHVVRNYQGDKTSAEWNDFMTYTKRIWFSNGIHHHYGMNKFIPTFGKEYFMSLLGDTKTELNNNIINIMFDPDKDVKKVNLDPHKGLLLGSATNFYDPDVTADEVDAFYTLKKNPNEQEPVAYGLNSKIVRNQDGSISERVWKVGGMYDKALTHVVFWLRKAVSVAENEAQKHALELLIEYYETGDLKKWDEYNIAWASATNGDIDYINGFVEVYNDPKGYRGSFESIVEINDFEASERMATLAENAQWFEDHSPILPSHKKQHVVGVSYKVVNVASEAGDASPSTPIGVNLPNSNWIRVKYGSKSVSLGNIVAAYNEARGPGLRNEFYATDVLKQRAKKYGRLAGELHTAMHEVIGHASGQLESGVGTPKETLKNYASALEEGRADLVALYYLMDPKLVELGLMPDLEVGKAAYDSYITNGLLMQLRRIEPGHTIEESHMRNRQMIANWAYQHGLDENVIEREEIEGKTYFVINDYTKLRVLFGELLREVQRIKSQGDYEAGKNLIEEYGVQVDQDLHNQVLDRVKALNSAPYGGFINPMLIPVTNDSGDTTDIKVEYPDNFTEQMLYYGDHYSYLPVKN